MNRPSRDPGRDNVQCIRAKTLPVVVTMPSRFGAEGKGAAVLHMPARFNQAERKTPAVITMPSRSSVPQQASVVEMPAAASARAEEEDGATLAVAPRKPQAERPGLSSSLRMTLMALLALLGWPRPTHGKDPGAAAARPWKLELLNVISRLSLPRPATSGGLVAQTAVLEFPPAIAEGADLVRAA